VVDVKGNLVNGRVCMEVDIRGEMRHRNGGVKRDVEQRHGLLRLQHARTTEIGYLNNIQSQT